MNEALDAFILKLYKNEQKFFYVCVFTGLTAAM